MKILLFGTSQIKYIKKIFLKHNIEVVELSDADYNKSLIAKFISFINKIKDVDFVYRVYNQSRLNWRFFVAKLLKKTTIIHWIGSDVIEEQKNHNRIGARINRFVTSMNLSCSPLIGQELSDMGIITTEIPIVPDIGIDKDYFVSNDHSVLVYIPKGREHFYGLHYIEKLASRFQNIKFHIVANDNDSIMLSNIIFHGLLSRVEMDELYKEITLLFRFPEHDGLSMMLLEALAKGKQVINSYKFPYTVTPKSRSFEDILDAFEKVVSKKPFYNKDGAQFVLTTYTEENIFEAYKMVLGIEK